MARSSPILVPVKSELDVFAARSRTRAFAQAVGFDSIAVTELTIASSELAWNIVKYTPGGDLTLAVVERELGEALELVARDDGPPFRDFAAATVDGHDDLGPIDPLSLWKRRGIGGGLGAVTRFTDELCCQTYADGKRVIARRYLARLGRAPRRPVPRKRKR